MSIPKTEAKLALTDQAGELVQVSLRKEFNGDDRKLAVTCRFKFTASNEALASIDPDLLDMFYRAADVIETQQQIDGVGSKPVRRTELIDHINLEVKNKDSTVTVHYGASGKSDVVLSGATVDKIGVDTLEGGSAEIGFTTNSVLDIKFLRPLVERWMEESVRFSVVPAVDPQGSLELQDKPPADAGKPFDTSGELDAGKPVETADAVAQIWESEDDKAARASKSKASGKAKTEAQAKVVTRVATPEEWPFPKDGQISGPAVGPGLPQ